MKNSTVKIGNKIFNSYKEYEAAYVKEWDRLHPLLPCDMNWIQADWKNRIENPQLY